MTDHTPPPMPDFPPPPPAPKKSRTNLVIIGSAAAVIAAIVATGVVVVQTRDDDSKPSAAATSSAPADDTAKAAAAEPDSTPSYADLDAESLTIDLKTKSKQCFGSAGCNLTVEPDLTLLVDSEDIDPDAVYEITYEIHGGEDGAVIETAELSDQTSLNYTPTVISTTSSGTKLSVEITDVAEQGA